MAEAGTLYGQRLENEESTQSLLSRRGSEIGSRYIQIDDSGIYLSSVAVTVLLSSVATIGVLLFTLVITLSVLLGSCQSQPMISELSESHTDSCASFRLNGEMNNLQGWLLPKECESYIANYMNGGQYDLDLQVAAYAVKEYVNAVSTRNDGLDAFVLDIDDTVLSNLPYYQQHSYGTMGFDENAWDKWVDAMKAPALMPMLSLYQELKQHNWAVIFITGRPERQRNSTVQNLLAAGYSGWASLNLRGKDDVGTTAAAYKSKLRLKFEKQGYRILGGAGDQWSDILGAAAGNRTFKLPNPMYYLF